MDAASTSLPNVHWLGFRPYDADPGVRQRLRRRPDAVARQRVDPPRQPDQAQGVPGARAARSSAPTSPRSTATASWCASPATRRLRRRRSARRSPTAAGHRPRAGRRSSRATRRRPAPGRVEPDALAPCGRLAGRGRLMCGIAGMALRRGPGRPETARGPWPIAPGPPRPRRARASGRRLGGLGPPPPVDHRRGRLAPADGVVRRTWHLAFNGEILNYRELGAELALPVRTDGDTEVLLAGTGGARAGRSSSAWGPVRLRGRTTPAPGGCSWRATGWASLPAVLLRATADLVAFASEIKALLPRCRRAPTVDEPSVDAYLAAPVGARAPHALRRRPQAAAPATVLESSSDGAVRPAPLLVGARSRRTRRDLGAEGGGRAGRATRSSTRVRGRRSSPTSRSGAYLSGGVDSSLIAALCGALRGRRQPSTRSPPASATPGSTSCPTPARVSEPIGTRPPRGPSCAPTTSRRCGRS